MATQYLNRDADLGQSVFTQVVQVPAGAAGADDYDVLVLPDLGRSYRVVEAGYWHNVAQADQDTNNISIEKDSGTETEVVAQVDFGGAAVGAVVLTVDTDEAVVPAGSHLQARVEVTAGETVVPFLVYVKYTFEPDTN